MSPPVTGSIPGHPSRLVAGHDAEHHAGVGVGSWPEAGSRKLGMSAETFPSFGFVIRSRGDLAQAAGSFLPVAAPLSAAAYTVAAEAGSCLVS
jgi:hypothetical protein